MIEVPRLLNATRGVFLYLPTLTAIHTGARLSEILGLRWQDVDFRQGTITFRQTLYWEKNGSYTFLSTKGGRPRIVIATSDLLKAFDEQRVRQAKWRLALGPDWPDHDLIITREDGEPLKQNTFSPAFAKLVRRLGLKVRFHDLRHTALTTHLAAGTDVKTISLIAGHSTPATTTAIYLHPGLELQRQAVGKYEKMLEEAARQSRDGRDTRRG